ncbi:hypothetical protein F4811DRAFT_526655 [Daldinia bambusicola]|nr:hypothetical protein F4811DRAFT_526655 [Daldinia bambusicola]
MVIFRIAYPNEEHILEKLKTYVEELCINPRIIAASFINYQHYHLTKFLVTLPTANPQVYNMTVVQIVHIVNNTSQAVHYHNHESGYSVTVPAKDRNMENNEWIPCSPYREDTVPKQSSGKFIRITVGDQAPFKLSDARWKFSFVDYPDGDTREGNERYIGDFNGGEKLVLRLDGLRNERTQLATTIYKVDGSLKEAGAGYVVASVLNSLATVVNLVLMAVHF